MKWTWVIFIQRYHIIYNWHITCNEVIDMLYPYKQTKSSTKYKTSVNQ